MMNKAMRLVKMSAAKLKEDECSAAFEMLVTVASGRPRVADGVGRLAPFMDSASDDSAANPTPGGVARNMV